MNDRRIIELDLQPGEAPSLPEPTRKGSLRKKAQRILSLSTCHISPLDFELLKAHGTPIPSYEHPEGYGNIIPVMSCSTDGGPWEIDGDQFDDMVRCGLSAAFVMLYRSAIANKIDFLQFDADAETFDEFLEVGWDYVNEASRRLLRIDSTETRLDVVTAPIPSLESLRTSAAIPPQTEYRQPPGNPPPRTADGRTITMIAAYNCNCGHRWQLVQRDSARTLTECRQCHANIPPLAIRPMRALVGRQRAELDRALEDGNVYMSQYQCQNCDAAWHEYSSDQWAHRVCTNDCPVEVAPYFCLPIEDVRDAIGPERTWLLGVYQCPNGHDWAQTYRATEPASPEEIAHECPTCQQRATPTIAHDINRENNRDFAQQIQAINQNRMWMSLYWCDTCSRVWHTYEALSGLHRTCNCGRYHQPITNYRLNAVAPNPSAQELRAAYESFQAVQRNRAYNAARDEAASNETPPGFIPPTAEEIGIDLISMYGSEDAVRRWLHHGEGGILGYRCYWQCTCGHEWNEAREEIDTGNCSNCTEREPYDPFYVHPLSISLDDLLACVEPVTRGALEQMIAVHESRARGNAAPTVTRRELVQAFYAARGLEDVPNAHIIRSMQRLRAHRNDEILMALADLAVWGDTTRARAVREIDNMISTLQNVRNFVHRELYVNGG